MADVNVSHVGQYFFRSLTITFLPMLCRFFSYNEFWYNKTATKAIFKFSFT